MVNPCSATTVARGCVIHFDGGEGPDAAPVSYAKDVAPILERKCVSCHSPGNIGSWSMSGHKKVKGMASMIEEVLLTRRMPPWDADPAIGKFANNQSLTVSEAQTLLRWVHQGATRGEGEDPLAALKAQPAPEEGQRRVVEEPDIDRRALGAQIECVLDLVSWCA